MKIVFHGSLVPFPMATIRGRLLLAGLSRTSAEDILLHLATDHAASKKQISFEDLAKKTRELVPNSFLAQYDLLSKYESLRRSDVEIPPLILVFEGASATGKSMLALDFISNLAITRIIGTDTVRQVLRAIRKPEEFPELYCHTYQAHKFRQAGPEENDPIIRGYLAQCELMETEIRTAVTRLVEEGTEALVEGVHILPGSLKDLNPGVVEILIHPDEDMHRSMFIAKHSAAGLKTVSADAGVREEEFRATRLIQDYMIQLAGKNAVDIVPLPDYEQAAEKIRQIILDKISQLMQDATGGDPV